MANASQTLEGRFYISAVSKHHGEVFFRVTEKHLVNITDQLHDLEYTVKPCDLATFISAFHNGRVCIDYDDDDDLHTF